MQQIHQSRYGRMLFKALVGSQAYGTATPSSDRDYKGVYVQPDNDILGFGYEEQYEDGKDEVYYEIRRFVELLQSANPTVLELLFMPEDCILVNGPAFELVRKHRSAFLTKKCFASFGGYTIAQIQKAKGLNKKMNWEAEKTIRKTPIDFCYAYQDGKTYALNEFLSSRGLVQERCGLVALDHFEQCYALYYDDSPDALFRGIIADDSNDVRLSSVPKGTLPLTIIYFNKSAYSQHCRYCREYEIWLEHRNTQRYVDVQGHQQRIDGKNLLHCRRLLDMALEIAREGTLNVRRPNAAELLAIRRGEVNLERIIAEAEADIALLNDLAQKSSLPENVSESLGNNIVLAVREAMRETIRETMQI